MEKVKVIINDRRLMIKEWARKNPKEFWILVVVLLVGAFFRLYKIGDYMTFLGDEGRDAIIVRRLLVEYDPILIGPRTSIGDMYLGPLYYYMMAIPLLFANFSPVGPSIMVALLGVATIFFVWYVVRELFTISNGKRTFLHAGALIAAFLYAISPVVITHSHSSWNPNIMPFFSLLCVYSIWKVWYENKYKWLVTCGISLAFVLQSHYLGLLLVPVLTLFWLLSIIRAWITDNQQITLLRFSVFALLVFLLLMSPLVIFDARHGWRNFASMKVFFTQRQTTVNLKAWKAVPKLWPIFKNSFVTRIVAGGNELVGKWTALILGVGLVYLVTTILYSIVVKKGGKISKETPAYLLIVIWLGVGLLGMSLYKQHVYDHYFGFIYPSIFILTGAFSEKVYEKFGDSLKIFWTAGLLLLVSANLLKNPFWYEPNHQMRRSLEVAKKIQEEAGNDMFNLAVLAERNYEDGYQYFLEKEGTNVVDIDPQIAEETTADQLFVVCEFSPKECDPTHSAKAQVANFGWSEIENQWEILGITVFKLVHTK